MLVRPIRSQQYGRQPLAVVDLLIASNIDTTAARICKARATILQELHSNLTKAISKMKKAADLHRIDVVFQVGNWVLLKLTKYRQATVAQRLSHKLAKKYYGPFEITAKVGPVAYQLNLPDSARIHNVLHVSKLKKFHGDPFMTIPANFLPLDDVLEDDHVFEDGGNDTTTNDLTHGRDKHIIKKPSKLSL